MAVASTEPPSINSRLIVIMLGLSPNIIRMIVRTMHNVRTGAHMLSAVVISRFSQASGQAKCQGPKGALGKKVGYRYRSVIVY